MANRLDYTYRRLVNALGPGRVARGAFETFVYGHDFAAMPKAAEFQFKFAPDFVVLPRTTEEVVRIVGMAAENLLPLTPRGGGTGRYGGSVPNRGGVLVDFRQMNRVLKVDAASRTMVVEAGCTWQEAYDRAWAAGMFLPVYPPFALGSTIGGWINGGGVGFGATKYGTSRDLVLNLEVVLADGSVVETGHDRIDLGTSHLNLGAVVWGSEGTLGLVTRATLRLYPRPEEIRALAYSFPSLEDAVPALRDLAALPVTPYHVTLVDPTHLQFLKAVRWEAPEPTAIVLVVLEGPKDENAEGGKLLDAAIAANGGGKMAAETAKQLWDDRLYQYPTRRIANGLVICEGIVPLRRFADALAKTRALTKAMKMEVALTGQLVDANSVALYPYFLDDETSPIPPMRLGFVIKWRELIMDQGSPLGEMFGRGEVERKLEGHPMGVGLFMAFNVPAMHGNAHRFFPAVKDAFDPNGRINFGKMHQIRTRFGLPGLRRIPLAIAALPFKVLGAVKAIIPVRDRFVRKYTGEGRER